MRKRDAVTFIFLLAALAAACQRPRVSDTSGPPPTEGTVELEHRFEGQLRTYRLHIPERAQEPYPLLVSLHGLGATARPMDRCRLSCWKRLVINGPEEGWPPIRSTPTS